MSQYTHHLTQGRASPFRAISKPDGHDDHRSQSALDDDLYLRYSKSELELEEDPNAFLIAQRVDGYDGRRSRSPSDDGRYLQYPKSENELEEDPNTSLVTQTLNVDGTPKRPMNAFMIFARRRRPQVSAENQAMRTDNISEILNREWNGMGLIEKQSYLDQAKQLKETFNMKYPDYIYRRRPNNSRKRRRADLGGIRALDQSVAGGDESCSTEFDDTCPGG